jgi:hypothetical protein
MPAITKRAVDEAKPSEKGGKLKDAFVWDSGKNALKGFGLKVTPAGAKVYIVQYRTGGRGTPTKCVTIGRHGSPWTTETARPGQLNRRAASQGDPRRTVAILPPSCALRRKLPSDMPGTTANRSRRWPRVGSTICAARANAQPMRSSDPSSGTSTRSLAHVGSRPSPRLMRTRSTSAWPTLGTPPWASAGPQPLSANELLGRA